MEEQIEIKRLMDLLNKANAEYPKRVREHAYALKNYRIILAKEMLLERDKGTPVTIISDIVRGKENVADAKELEIISEGLKDSCKEAINSYKLQIKTIKELMEKEIGDSI